MARVTSDSDRVAELVTWGVAGHYLGDRSTSLHRSVFMLVINWRLGADRVGDHPAGAGPVAVQFRKKILVEFRQPRKLNSKITGAYNENITGVRVVKALGREDENLREFSDLTGEMYRSAYRAAWLSALFLPRCRSSAPWRWAASSGYGGFRKPMPG